MNVTRRWLCSLLTVMLLASAGQSALAEQQIQRSVYMLLYPGNTTAFVNGDSAVMDAGVESIGGDIYVPAAWFGNALHMKPVWQEKTGAVEWTAPKAFLQFYLGQKVLLVNGERSSFEQAALVKNDKLLVKLSWLANYIGYKYSYNDTMKRVELLYVPSGDAGLFRNDAIPNTRPVARFSTSKDTYKIGEKIQYTNLSFDPDMDGLTYDWTGKQDVFFEAGSYDITLKATDSKGNESYPYTKRIVVTGEALLSYFDYQIVHQPVGTFVKYDEPTLRKYLRGIPQLPNVVKHPQDRPLIVSDSPETFTEKGFLYQESINGKARLYADHVNGMNEKVQFAIIVRNPSFSRSVNLTTTNSGEVYPSIYANLIGNEASLQFLLNEQSEKQTISIGPGQTVFYKKMPNFYPGQGMNVLYDVESDGELYVSFVAMGEDDTIQSLGSSRQLDYTGNVRGTFPWSEVRWDVDARAFDKPSSLTIGDGTSDVFVTGTDFYMKKDALNLGNYGVLYKIHINEPRKMAVLVLPRGGVFKGPFLVNGKIVQSPPSGVMSDYEGYTIIARTDGTEKSLDIDFTPAAGSAFPIDIIFYPID